MKSKRQYSYKKNFLIKNNDIFNVEEIPFVNIATLTRGKKKVDNIKKSNFNGTSLNIEYNIGLQKLKSNEKELFTNEEIIPDNITDSELREKYRRFSNLRNRENHLKNLASPETFKIKLKIPSNIKKETLNEKVKFTEKEEENFSNQKENPIVLEDRISNNTEDILKKGDILNEYTHKAEDQDKNSSKEKNRKNNLIDKHLDSAEACVIKNPHFNDMLKLEHPVNVTIGRENDKIKIEEKLSINDNPMKNFNRQYNSISNNDMAITLTRTKIDKILQTENNQISNDREQIPSRADTKYKPRYQSEIKDCGVFPKVEVENKGFRTSQNSLIENDPRTRNLISKSLQKDFYNLTNKDTLDGYKSKVLLSKLKTRNDSLLDRDSKLHSNNEEKIRYDYTSPYDYARMNSRIIRNRLHSADPKINAINVSLTYLLK